MFTILDAIVKIMAPILPFTADEIYGHMPKGIDHKESIHLDAMVKLDSGWEDTALSEKWENIRHLRSEVTRALEEARIAKLIGHPLDACLEIQLPETEIKEQIANLTENLNDIFIVSMATVIDTLEGDVYTGKEMEGLKIKVTRAVGEKCERCWRFDTTIGADDDHPTACERCAGALKQIL